METTRLSWRWIAVGAISVVGAYWLIVFGLVAIQFPDAWLPYMAHALAASIVGVTMMLHAPFRPWREPAIAGALGVVVLAVIMLALPHATFGWVATRTAQPWLVALGLAAMSALFAFAGAVLMRRTSLSKPSTIAVVMLSAVVVTGVSIVLAQTLSGLGVSLEQTGQRVSPMLLVTALIGMMSGSFVTQSVVKDRRPWACSVGTTVFGLLEIHSWTQALALVVGVPIALAIASVGARLYWHWYGGAVEPDEPMLPPAKIQ
jgi:hypothetical protein